jgi:hypothetical protein
LRRRGRRPDDRTAVGGLRSANLRVQGGGQGAVGSADYLAELPSLIDAISNGAIAVKANTVPLADVEQAWTRTEAPGERAVLMA